jgi:hypothetical protein
LRRRERNAKRAAVRGPGLTQRKISSSSDHRISSVKKTCFENAATKSLPPRREGSSGGKCSVKVAHYGRREHLRIFWREPSHTFDMAVTWKQGVGEYITSIETGQHCQVSMEKL